MLDDDSKFVGALGAGVGAVVGGCSGTLKFKATDQGS